MGMKMKNYTVDNGPVDIAIILRRVSKLLKETPDSPAGAQWTGNTLPKSLKQDAGKLYRKYGVQAGRANEFLVMKDSWKMAVKRIKKKWSTSMRARVRVTLTAT